MYKNCAYCGKLFDTKKSNKIYCNKICQEKFYQKKRVETVKSERNSIIKRCRYCGKLFETCRHRKLNCSRDCTYKYNEIVKSGVNVKEKLNRAQVKESQKGLVNDAVAARKAGMTYGQYKAMKYMEKMKEKGL